MALQYWVGDFFIDLSRNQITYKKEPQTIAPKALAVLTCLAENQGKVVSHDTLLAHVWKGTSVSPNTLQRSITQLRKALGDDGKTYIKTHAKQGYSLECNVQWQREDSDHSIEHKRLLNAKPNPSQTISMNSFFSYAAIVIGVIALILIGFKVLSTKSAATLSFGELRLLTATDNKELGGIYSPDGKYIVFRRYTDVFCVNNIWAKDTKTQQEFQLTERLNIYGRHSFSTDGQKLAFIQSTDCNKPISQKECYTLMLLDFKKALTSPQSPTELMECKNSRIKSPIWLNNNDIALLQKKFERWQLIRYSIDDNKSQVIYELDDGNLISYDYLAKEELIALTSIHGDGHYYIETLKPNGQVLSSHRIQYPDEIANSTLIYPNFSILDNRLIFSTGRQLFTLSYEGQVTNISLPLDEPMGSPVFHPDGDRMLVIKGYYDSDIVSMPLSQMAQSKNASLQDINNNRYPTIARSIFSEHNAIFQPNGELIAFTSTRSGEEQVWLANGQSLQQLSNFPTDTYKYGMAWSEDGKSILVNANKTLTQLFLDGSEVSLPIAYPVSWIFHWSNEQQTALVNVQINGVTKFAELDLANLEVHIIDQKRVNWATKSETGQLIYTDQMGRFWLSGPAEDLHIEALKGQTSDKRFVVKGSTIYGVNDDFQLWSYALDSKIFKVIGKVPQNIDYLTDINDEQLLMVNLISEKKEVAELTLKK